MKSRSLCSSVLVVLVLGGAGIALGGQFSIASADEFLYDSHNRRDPFIPMVGPGAKGDGEPSIPLVSIKLEGVVVDPKQGSFVMINGEIYEEGQSVGPYLVEKIEEKRVVLKYNKDRYEIRLNEE